MRAAVHTAPARSRRRRPAALATAVGGAVQTKRYAMSSRQLCCLALFLTLVLILLVIHADRTPLADTVGDGLADTIAAALHGRHDLLHADDARGERRDKPPLGASLAAVSRATFPREGAGVAAHHHDGVAFAPPLVAGGAGSVLLELGCSWALGTIWCRSAFGWEGWAPAAAFSVFVAIGASTVREQIQSSLGAPDEPDAAAASS